MVITDNSPTDVGLVGGSGFIGSVLAKLLIERGHKVRILDIADPPPSNTAEYRYCDVTNLALLTDMLRGCRLIINLAAAHRDNVRPRSLYHKVNVIGAKNVCCAAESLEIEDIIFTSSVAVYGFPEGVPDECTPPSPFNLYGQTKWEAEVSYREWQQKDPKARRLEIVRPTVIFGEGNRGNVYNLLVHLSRPQFVMVGDGKNRKSIAYVGNIAAFLAHLTTADHGAGAWTYNYCDAPTYNMNELLRLVRTALRKSPEPSARLPYAAGIAIGSLFDVVAWITGKTLPISKVRIEKFCANSVFSSELARGENFKAPYDLRDALHRTIAYEFLTTTSH